MCSDREMSAIFGLKDGLKDMILGGRLTPGLIPDDFQWLVEAIKEMDEATREADGDEDVEQDEDELRWLKVAQDAMAAQGTTTEAPEESTQADSPAEMTASLDGGDTWVPAKQGVLVNYNDVLVNGEDDRGVVEIKLTHEGIITDIWVTRPGDDGKGEDHNIGTEAVMMSDLVARLVDENA